MDVMYDKAFRGSEVPLRALWCKVERAVMGCLVYNPVNGVVA